MRAPPTAVIFDLDGVLCRYDLERRLEHLSRLAGRPPADIRRDLWESGFEDAADAGRWADGASYLAEFARRLGHPLTTAQWVEARKASMTPWPEMLRLVEAVGRSSITAILTNNVPLLAETLGEVVPDIARLFGERVFFSCHLRLAKPDPEIYRVVCRSLGREPAEAVFIDDKAENAQGAERAGLAGIHFTGAEALVAELARLGVAT